jgi:superfamily II DNA or RNA helicase
MTVVPEQGQLVRVRHRHYVVQDVWPGSVEPSRPPQHRVRLEALDDDALGETLDVIWEHEVNTVVHDQLGLPRPEAWDPKDRFEAFLLATRWSLSSVLEGLPLQAPFRGAIQIEDFQLEPVVRALRMPRVNLLIADDVGLGKTIEAGMVMQELLARQRIRRIMVLCPASLQQQWAEEMLTKFALRFEIVDRAYMQRLRREYGPHVNPWASYPRLITSMDFLKRETPLASFLASLRKDRAGGLRDWDLLVVDEAHNVAPSGRTAYVRDSDRTHMLRQIIGHFEHRLFLTATPHNGFTESFTALLEMLDPLRFSRGPTVNKEQLKTVMVRRIKDDLVDALGRRRFPKREVEALPAVKLAPAEREMLRVLDHYMELRLGRAGGIDRLPVRFALTLLKKRLLSSPLAFSNSIQVHHTHLHPEEQPGEEHVQVVQRLKERLEEDFADDEEKDRTEETAQAEASGFFSTTDEEHQLVEKLVELGGRAAEKPDSKVKVFLDWVDHHLFTDGRWNGERVLVFTEYKHTLNYLVEILHARGWAEQVLTLHGGTGVDREQIKAAFRAPPSESAVRILVATDAASEGLNLQDHCRYLIHWEIPWNPNKMEQRNGRIDRHGQRAEKVFCWHFTYEGWEDQQFLDVVVDKVRTQRADLGSVGDVIAAQVEEALRGERRVIQTPEDRRNRLRAEVESELLTQDRIRALQHELSEARRVWHLYPETLKLVLDQALQLSGHAGLEDVEGELAGRACLLRNLPAAWAECRTFIQDVKGRLLRLVFDERNARDLKDVALLHLDHPLMKRALGVFRANLWSVGLHETHQLARVSYKVMPQRDLARPVVLLVARLICVSQLGQKLHEELVLVGGEMQETAISLADSAWLATLLEADATFPPLPKEIAEPLRRFFPAHEKILLGALETQAKEREKDIRARLRQRGTDEAGQVRKLIDERVKEVERRIKEMEKELGTTQLDLFDDIERDQYQRDLSWLRSRKEGLLKERETEPEAVKQRYVLRDRGRAFPLALLYLLPDTLLEGGR